MLFLYEKNNLSIKINKRCDISEKNSLPISKKTSKPNSRLKQIQRGQFINQAKRKVKQEPAFNLGCSRTISSSCLCAQAGGGGASPSQLCQHHVWRSWSLYRGYRYFYSRWENLRAGTCSQLCVSFCAAQPFFGHT